MTSCELPDPLNDLPPTRNHVYRVLDDMGESTRSDLADATGLTPRSITNALADLRAAGLIVERTDPLDTRRKRYRLK